MILSSIMVVFRKKKKKLYGKQITLEVAMFAVYSIIVKGRLRGIR